MNIPFVKYRRISYVFSGLLILASVAAVVFFGLKPGIDFTGGSILELEYKQARPSNREIEQKLSGLDLGSFNIQPTGEKGAILRTKEIDEKAHQEILSRLGEGGTKVDEIRFESLGPMIGQELRQKTNLVMALALLSMVIYIALAFRKVQRPLNSWQYGIASLIALFHDVFIPLGVFAVLGKFYNVEISIPVITSILIVLGYSINNTVVVFDRIRENLLRGGLPFEETANNSINQTLARQINTSLATLFSVVAIYIFGGETLKYFSLTLILGITAGTYSSIFIAAPILVSWLKWREKRKGC